MKYFAYLKERVLTLFVFLWLVFSIETFLLTVKASEWLAVFVAVNLVGAYFLITYSEFIRLKKQYEELREAVDSMEEKYLAPEILGGQGTEEELFLKEILHDMVKSMAETVNRYKRELKEYKEYIELWIHEIKIPIAAADMITENHKNETTKEIGIQLKRIAGYTEQVLYYARSNEVEKDYFIKDVVLEKVINEVLAANRKELITLGTSITMHDLNVTVKSDGKWLFFIIGQLVNNSIKYRGKENLHLELYGKENPENVQLFIKDNGVGIKSNEIARVFDKGFTGQNGRIEKKATGIGLYLCKKLCGRLRHNIEVRSGEGEGCEVILTFPKSSFVDVF